ncbi:DegV family EDD domain-containing protein [Pontibacillus yanchengensis]|uniref:DegV family EDD domain-containing protein n=1 Tax=Pontibacillus yanchengensis TaxID=462910 RepID=A0A6I5A711_9BACI|nr:DegV family EDD domain-containing protein [Pontibacillus yanchengensis]
MHIQLITDGGSDLPPHLIEAYNVKIVPLNIHFGEQQYVSGVDLDIQTFYKKMKEEDELPRSSAPSPYAFYETFKEIDPEKPILMLALSKSLSTTHDNAIMGKEMLLEEEPERTIVVLNTKTATSGMSLLIDEAGKCVKNGMEFEPLVAHMEERIEQTTTLFILRTVENLIKGGRLDRFKGAIAKTLNIKLLMKATDEGEIDVAEKVRGNKKAMRRFIEQIGETTTNFENKVISLSYSTTEDKAKKLLQEMKERYAFKDSILMEMGPLCATYAGEGGYVMSFFVD